MNLPVIVATALVASIVAGGLLWGGIALLLRLRHFDATTRHALWFTSLIVVALLPFAGVAASVVHSVRVPSQAEGTSTTTSTASSARAAAPVQNGTLKSASSKHETGSAVQHPTPATTVASAPANRMPWLFSAGVAGGSLAVLGFFAIVALAGLIGLAISVHRITAVKLRSSPLDESLSNDLPWLTETHRGRETYVRLSYEIEAPVAIGFNRPVILIPTELATKSGLTAIEDLVIHEHAHLVRYDDYTNLVQRTIERVFWFNPFVWIIGRRITLEREMAADDAVVARTEDRTKYADALWRLAREMRMPAHTVVAPGALFTRKQISLRIEALLAPGRAQLRRLGPASAACAAAVVVVCGAVVALAAPPLELPAPPAPPSLAARPRLPAPPAPAKHSSAAALHANLPVVVAHAKAPDIGLGEVHLNAPPVRVVEVNAVQIETSGVHAKSPGVHVSVPAVHAGAPTVRAEARKVPAAPVAPKTAEADGQVSVAIPPIEVDVPGVKVRVPAISVKAPLTQTAPVESKLVAQLDNKDANSGLTRSLIARCIGCDLSGRDLRNFDLHGIEMSGVNLRGADLRGANLRGTRLIGADLTNAKLDGADLTDAHFSGADIAGASFRGAQMTGVQFVGISLQHGAFDNAGVREILLHGCSGCDLARMDLRGIDLHDVKLVGADFAHSDLSGANLSGAEFSGVSFDHANLNNADLRNASLVGCSLHGTSLQNIRLDGIHLSGTSLSL